MSSNDGTVLEKEDIQLLGPALIQKLKVRDIKAITEKLGELPSVNLVIDVDCPGCGVSFKQGIDSSFLFTRD